MNEATDERSIGLTGSNGQTEQHMNGEMLDQSSTRSEQRMISAMHELRNGRTKKRPD